MGLNYAWRERVRDFNSAPTLRYPFADAVLAWHWLALCAGAFLFGLAVGGC